MAEEHKTGTAEETARQQKMAQTTLSQVKKFSPSSLCRLHSDLNVLLRPRQKYRKQCWDQCVGLCVCFSGGATPGRARSNDLAGRSTTLAHNQAGTENTSSSAIAERPRGMVD